MQKYQLYQNRNFVLVISFKFDAYFRTLLYKNISWGLLMLVTREKPTSKWE